MSGIIHPFNGIPLIKWLRQMCWPGLPYISATEQVAYIPFAIFNDDSNYFACLCRGAYTVDTGDGVITNVADNTKFEYKFDYTTAPTLCIRGYKAVLIKITPQSGNNLIVVSIQQYHTAIGTGKQSNILEVVLNVPNCAGTGLANTLGGAVALHNMCESIIIKKSAITAMTGVAYNMPKLRNFDVNSTQAISAWGNAFIAAGLEIYDSTVFGNTVFTGNCANLFNTLSGRQVVVLTSMAGVTSTTAMFGTFGNYSKIICTGLPIGVSVASQKMSASALNAFGNSLGIANGAQTINIANNPGTSTCTQSIFTNKGYSLILA